jgi:hypothetical protein
MVGHPAGTGNRRCCLGAMVCANWWAVPTLRGRCHAERQCPPRDRVGWAPPTKMPIDQRTTRPANAQIPRTHVTKKHMNSMMFGSKRFIAMFDPAPIQSFGRDCHRKPKMLFGGNGMWSFGGQCPPYEAGAMPEDNAHPATRRVGIAHHFNSQKTLTKILLFSTRDAAHCWVPPGGKRLCFPVQPFCQQGHCHFAI